MAIYRKIFRYAREKAQIPLRNVVNAITNIYEKDIKAKSFFGSGAL
jgi:hypothetical protein